MPVRISTGTCKALGRTNAVRRSWTIGSSVTSRLAAGLAWRVVVLIPQLCNGLAEVHLQDVNQNQR